MIDKEKLFKNSETLKNYAIDLFSGEDSISVVYGLVHAASEIIKADRSILYKDSIMQTLSILLHLDDCKGCNNDGEEKIND